MPETESHSTPTGQWLYEADGHRWWFESGALSLDFGYASFVNPADLAVWLGERFARLHGTATERELTDAEGLADAIARVAIARTRGERAGRDDIDVINLYAALPDVAPSLPGGRRQAGATKTRVANALASVARDAVDLFSNRGLPAGAGNPGTPGAPSAPSVLGEGRIRSCAAADCEIVFYDGSRSNNRRWCSMQRCGNRAKVRAHRARTGEVPYG